MWLFSTRGFVSIVANRNDPAAFLVRGRFKGDVNAVFPGVDVQITPDADYRFRASVPRDEVARQLAQLAGDIDYDNFKTAAPGDRHGVYLQVWSAMMTEQERRALRGHRFVATKVPPKQRKRRGKKATAARCFDDARYPLPEDEA